MVILAAVMVVAPAVMVCMAEAEQSNENLYVSAENGIFENRFAGSMVVEVIISDPRFSDTAETRGEPDVSINGRDLRMVQATDGNWYAYFANYKAALAADATSVGAPGTGLDFGMFCGPDTALSVLGIDISETRGVAVPREGFTGASNGDGGIPACTGTEEMGHTINNVVRRPRSINTGAVPDGQIGLDPMAWPLVQLFSFENDVTIRYERAGPTQHVTLRYDDEIPISMELDRERYPSGAHVILTIRDAQLNQDPTDEDSWTFNIADPAATFYQAFDERGRRAAAPANLAPDISRLGFDENGILSVDLGQVISLGTSKVQPVSSITGRDGSSYHDIVTLLESDPSSGIFFSHGYDDSSVIRVRDDAPRGRAGTITYNDESVTVLSGPSTASISLDGDEPALPGRRIAVQIIDPDQNIDPRSRDVMDVSKGAAAIPTILLGSPVTLKSASMLALYLDPHPSKIMEGISHPFTHDRDADRLLIHTGGAMPGGIEFDMISMRLGVTAEDLHTLLAGEGVSGTNWINVDLRSMNEEFGVGDFSGTRALLYFGLDDPSPIQILDPGDISSGQALVLMESSDVESIFSGSGEIFLVIDFDAYDSGITGTLPSETGRHPIVFDLFSFGQDGDRTLNIPSGA